MPGAVSGKVNCTAAEALPLATTTSEYVPGANPAGSVNSVDTTLFDVITPVLLQLYVRA